MSTLTESALATRRAVPRKTADIALFFFELEVDHAIDAVRRNTALIKRCIASVPACTRAASCEVPDRAVARRVPSLVMTNTVSGVSELRVVCVAFESAAKAIARVLSHR